MALSQQIYSCCLTSINHPMSYYTLSVYHSLAVIDRIVDDSLMCIC